jgi:hypothetical protein
MLRPISDLRFVPTTDMTERQLDVLIAGIGLLYGGSSPRKRKRLCGLGF